jgi:hypothetical protein
MNLQFKNDKDAKTLKRWASVGNLYSQYGQYLIRQYPKEFVSYYLIPNVLNYYAPPLEFLDSYNMGRDTVAEIATIWFHYKSNQVRSASKDLRVNALNFYPVLGGILNTLFLVSILFYSMLKGFGIKNPFNKPLILVTALWIANFLFSVLASPIALRFQIFQFVISSSFTLLLIEYISRAAFAKDNGGPQGAIPPDLSTAL